MQLETDCHETFVTSKHSAFQITNTLKCVTAVVWRLPTRASGMSYPELLLPERRLAQQTIEIKLIHYVFSLSRKLAG